MSVTIQTDVLARTTFRDEPCLCAQMSPAFGRFFRGDDTPEARADLKLHADEFCRQCGGSGVESVRQTDALELNVSNQNARSLFGLLGFADPFYGQCDLPTFRRALIRARNVDPSRYCAQLDQPAISIFRGGDQDLHAVLFCSSQGATPERLAGYLVRLDAIVRQATERQATRVFWL